MCNCSSHFLLYCTCHLWLRMNTDIELISKQENSKNLHNMQSLSSLLPALLCVFCPTGKKKKNLSYFVIDYMKFSMLHFTLYACTWASATGCLLLSAAHSLWLCRITWYMILGIMLAHPSNTLIILNTNYWCGLNTEYFICKAAQDFGH